MSGGVLSESALEGVGFVSPMMGLHQSLVCFSGRCLRGFKIFLVLGDLLVVFDFGGGGGIGGGDLRGAGQIFTKPAMKPTSLHPGIAVVIGERLMTFIRRDRDARPPQNVFQCMDFVGLDGAGDNGLCTVTDYRVSRLMKPATQKGAQ